MTAKTAKKATVTPITTEALAKDTPLAPGLGAEVVAAAVKALVDKNSEKSKVVPLVTNKPQSPPRAFNRFADTNSVTPEVGAKPLFTQEHYGYRTTLVGEEAVMSEVKWPSTFSAFNKMQTGLVVMGMLLAPVKTVTGKDLHPSYGFDEERNTREFGFTALNYALNELGANGDFKDESFDIYRFILNKIPFTIALDSNSKLFIDKNPCPHAPWSLQSYKITRESPISLIMINSVAIECNFFDGCFLQNVDLKRCVVQGSSIQEKRLTDKELNEQHWTGLRQPYEAPEDLRRSFHDVEVICSSIYNSEVTRGTLYGSSLKSSSVKSTDGPVDLINSTVKDSTIESMGTLFLGMATVDRSSIKSRAPARIASQTLRDARISTEGIYARNKFSITEIEVPNQSFGSENYKLTRININEVVLSCGYGETRTKKFKLNTDSYRLHNEVGDFLRNLDKPDPENHYADHVPRSSVITESIRDYIITTVASRLKVMLLLDDVMQTSRNAENKDMSAHFSDYF